MSSPPTSAGVNPNLEYFARTEATVLTASDPESRLIGRPTHPRRADHVVALYERPSSRRHRMQ